MVVGRMARGQGRIAAAIATRMAMHVRAFMCTRSPSLKHGMRDGARVQHDPHARYHSQTPAPAWP
eukprot:795154-Pleurochrysis_carterae.AAC.1